MERYIGSSGEIRFSFIAFRKDPPPPTPKREGGGGYSVLKPYPSLGKPTVGYRYAEKEQRSLHSAEVIAVWFEPFRLNGFSVIPV